jgi:hypothetical protein
MLSSLSGLKTTDVVDTPNGRMVVVGQSWPAGTDVDAVLAGTAAPDTVMLSSDGRAWWSEWHTGAECGDVAYVERYSLRGREFHGWVDARSRRIVQTG